MDQIEALQLIAEWLGAPKKFEGGLNLDGAFEQVHLELPPCYRSE